MGRHGLSGMSYSLLPARPESGTRVRVYPDVSTHRSARFRYALQDAFENAL
jgi:hypothetical protein